MLRPPIKDRMMWRRCIQTNWYPRLWRAVVTTMRPLTEEFNSLGQPYTVWGEYFFAECSSSGNFNCNFAISFVVLCCCNPRRNYFGTQWDTIHNKIGSYIVSLLEKALTKHVVLLELELPCNERLLLLPLDDGAQVPRLSLNLCVNRLQRILQPV